MCPTVPLFHPESPRIHWAIHTSVWTWSTEADSHEDNGFAAAVFSDLVPILLSLFKKETSFIICREEQAEF